MNQHEIIFLEALKASLANTTVTWSCPFSTEEWQALFALAESQKVLPLIFHAVYSSPAAAQMDKPLYDFMKHRVRALTMNQVQRTAEFLNLYQKFQKENIEPLVVKGLICRELYPNPDFRISSDEDLLISEDQFAKAIEVLKSCDMKPLKAEGIDETIDEIGFIATKGISYIELHRQLFSERSESYGELNRYFKNCFDEKIFVHVQGTKVYTLEPGAHLFYLICHAFKHFLHSGFGLRQVCDIVIFANAYGKEVNWQTLLTQCREIRADKFAAALFKIGKNYLTFDFERACYPKSWQEIEIDEQAMLMDLLQSGIYGSSTMSRSHSAQITLEAASSVKAGRNPANAVIAAAFPTAKELEGRFPYLKDKPYLLPVAWTSRILKYQKEIKMMNNNSAVEAIRIGNERVALLKKYGIIE